MAVLHLISKDPDLFLQWEESPPTGHFSHSKAFIYNTANEKAVLSLFLFRSFCMLWIIDYFLSSFKPLATSFW